MTDFNLERDMSAAAWSWLERQRLIIKSEFVLPWGVCDFVAVEFAAARVRERMRLGQKRAIGSRVRLEVLHHIPDVRTGCAIPIRTLSRRFAGFLSESLLRRELDWLEQSGFVKRNGGAVAKINGWAPLHRRIVALELKLNRVDDVIHQAISHRSFATESYIGLPLPIAENTVRNRADVLESAQVGVLGLYAAGSKVVLPAPRQTAPVDVVTQAHCLERFWRSVTSS